MENFKMYVYKKTGLLWDSIPVLKLDELFIEYKHDNGVIISEAMSRVTDAWYMLQDLKNGETGMLTREERIQAIKRTFTGKI